MSTQNSPAVAHDADVVIVGHGPAGATLANLLGQSGVSTLVLEREEAAYHLPRAVHFDDECMRVFETIGLSQAIEPIVHVSTGMRFVDAAGQTLLEWPRPQERTPMGWHASYRFHQPELERILRDALGRFPCVRTRTRVEVLAVDEDASGVTIRAENLRTGVLERVRARYVVGCDGARSFIRRKIGETLDDLHFDERWLVVDVLLKERSRNSATGRCSIATPSARQPMSAAPETGAAGKSPARQRGQRRDGAAREGLGAARALAVAAGRGA